MKPDLVYRSDKRGLESPSRRDREGEKAKPPKSVTDVGPEPEKTAPLGFKTSVLVALLGRPEGATIEEMMRATGWKSHSVRGALSGAVKKKLGQPVQSKLVAGVRRYSAMNAVPDEAQADKIVGGSND